RPIWPGSSLFLALLAAGLVTLHSGALTAAEAFVAQPASVTAEQVRLVHYPVTGTDPLTVLANPTAQGRVATVLQSDPGLVAPPGGIVGQPLGDKVFFQIPMADAADSPAAAATVERLRPALHAIPDADAVVSGTTAVRIDVEASAAHDRNWVIPIVLAIAFVILIVLLRALIAPILLIVSVVASFLAALGASVFVFQVFFHQHHEDNSYPLF